MFPIVKAGVLAAVALVLAGGPAHAQTTLPFQATFTGTFEILNGDPAALDLRVSGASMNAPFGLVRNEGMSLINMTVTPPTFVGSATFIAANGNRLFTDLSGTLNAAGVGIGTERFVGGTGIFAGATGLVSLTTTATFLTATTGTFEDVFDGTITLQPQQTIPEPGAGALVAAGFFAAKIAGLLPLLRFAARRWA